MINRVTGEVSFRSGLNIQPHCSIRSLFKDQPGLQSCGVKDLPLNNWKRYLLGFHDSRHGTFEVEALTHELERVYVVMLSHQHAFYEPGTPEDSERRAFHEGVISSDLSGQREFTWGEVRCRFDAEANKDWLVVSYRRELNVPSQLEAVLLSLNHHEVVSKSVG